jgi:ABC-type transport system substrate-binding protein
MNYLPKRILIFFWFATGYVRRHFFFVLAGVLLGILGFFEAGPLLALIPELKKPLKIGIVGKYGLNEMPLEVQRLVSRGLTKVGPDGTWKADLSESWQISEDGKEYT